MDLFDRYINEVGRRLPKRIRGDVEQELHSLLLDSLEDRMGEEFPEDGEAPEELQVAILKEFGPPRKVAEQYNPRVNYIIGPRFFEPYLMTLAIVLGITFIAHLFGIITLMSEPIALRNSFDDAIAGLFQSLQAGLGAVTLIFALIERAIPSTSSKEAEASWDPRKLPKVGDYDRIKLSGLILETVFVAFLLAMLNFYPDRIGLSFVQVSGEFKMTSWLAPGFHKMYGPWLSAWWFLVIVLNIAVFWQGRWQHVTHLLKAGLNLAGALIFYRIATGPDFIVTASGGIIGEIAQMPGVMNNIFGGVFRSTLGIVALSLAFSAGKILYRLFQPEPIVMLKNLNKSA